LYCKLTVSVVDRNKVRPSLALGVMDETKARFAQQRCNIPKVCKNETEQRTRVYCLGVDRRGLQVGHRRVSRRAEGFGIDVLCSKDKLGQG
jgi:hypothetical protein